MTKNNGFDDDILIDQPEMGCYYHTNMFRFPEEELYRPQVPPMKSQPMTTPSMTTPAMSGPNMSGPTMTGPSMMAPISMPEPSGFQFPIMDEQATLSPTLTNIGYTQAFLRTLIGRNLRVSFLIGTNLQTDRVGTLLQVGISYIVLRQLDSNIDIMCDLYSIKFVDIFPSR
jgi:hypothetical protein